MNIAASDFIVLKFQEDEGCGVEDICSRWVSMKSNNNEDAWGL